MKIEKARSVFQSDELGNNVPTIKPELKEAYDVELNESLEGSKQKGAVALYAYQWAVLMEWYKKQGVEISECAHDASCIVDKDSEAQGLSGGMFAAAVNILIKYWVYGEELSTWYKSSSRV